jgi:hypothetical protein
MNTSRPRVSIMVAWEKCPLGWRILGDVICVFGKRCSWLNESLLRHAPCA